MVFVRLDGVALLLGKAKSEGKIHMASRRRHSLMETIEISEFLLCMRDVVATLIADGDYTRA